MPVNNDRKIESNKHIFHKYDPTGPKIPYQHYHENGYHNTQGPKFQNPSTPNDQQETSTCLSHIYKGKAVPQHTYGGAEGRGL
jgi:hypothetical protein